MITDTLRLELAPWKVSVSVVEPGYVQTALAEKQTGENAPWRSADPVKRRRCFDLFYCSNCSI